MSLEVVRWAFAVFALSWSFAGIMLGLNLLKDYRGEPRKEGV